MIKKTFSEEEIAKVEAFKEETTNEKEKINASIILLLSKGTSHKTITSSLSVSENKIYRTRNNFLRNSVRSLMHNKKGRKYFLNSEQKEKLHAELLQQSEKGATINVDLLEACMKKLFTIRYKSKTSYRLLLHEFNIVYHKSKKKYFQQQNSEKNPVMPMSEIMGEK